MAHGQMEHIPNIALIAVMLILIAHYAMQAHVMFQTKSGVTMQCGP